MNVMKTVSSKLPSPGTKPIHFDENSWITGFYVSYILRGEIWLTLTTSFDRCKLF